MNLKDVKSIGARLASGQKPKTLGLIDAEAVRELSDLLNETGLTEIEIEQSGMRIRVARHSNGQAAPVLVSSAHPATPAQDIAASKGPIVGAVTSPMVGTVYIAPEPGSQAFVKVGQTVKEGDTLLIVEAMKTMNPITAPHGGIVKEICVKDAQPVEFGQLLIVIA
jgi:acetyl-CoA carboxylase biotin carboxyl carrier protein